MTALLDACRSLSLSSGDVENLLPADSGGAERPRDDDLAPAAVAERLLSAVREHDTVSRQGGDEFVVILPNTAAEGAAHVAAKICELIAEPFKIEQHCLRVTTSIGIAMFPQHAGDFDTLARAADAAMYRAKRDGRNRYCFHEVVHAA